MFEKGLAKKAERDAVRRRSSMPPAPDDAAKAPRSIVPPLAAPHEDVDISFQDSDVFGSSPPPRLELEMEVEVPPAPLLPSANPPRPPLGLRWRAAPVPRRCHARSLYGAPRSALPAAPALPPGR